MADRVRKSKSKDRAGDFLGAVVPLRAREIPQELPREADLSNVIPISSRRRIGPEKRIPELKIAADDRPAPLVAFIRRRRHLLLFLSAVFLTHAAILAAFNRPAPPLASVGEVSVSVELVLGTNREAGRSNTPSQSDISSAANPEKNEPDAEQTESPRKATEVTALQDLKEPDKPAESSPQPPESAPMSAAIAPHPAAELPMPAKEQPQDSVKSKPEEKQTPSEQKREPAPAKKRARETADGQSERKRAAPSSTPSVASNSIGIGRSDASSNYRGLVAAHLARYKQFPSDARASGQQGTASVSFNLNGSGRVTSVRLARSSGVPSIDQETQAMVRRASPFPAPPDGRAQGFTVPVQFYLR